MKPGVKIWPQFKCWDNFWDTTRFELFVNLPNDYKEFVISSFFRLMVTSSIALWRRQHWNGEHPNFTLLTLFFYFHPYLGHRSISWQWTWHLEKFIGRDFRIWISGLDGGSSGCGSNTNSVIHTSRLTLVNNMISFLQAMAWR